MSVNHLSCQMCLTQCSISASPFWHYEYLLNEYDDFNYIPNPLPSKICTDCGGNIARLIAFRDRIRCTQLEINEMSANQDLSLCCRICKIDCEDGDLKTSTIPFVLRLCSGLSLVPNHDFWGRICYDCAEDLKILGYYIRKYREVQIILQLEEFEKNFGHLNVDLQELLSKCHKKLAEYRTKMGDEICKQELSYIANFYQLRGYNNIESAIAIPPTSFFAIEGSANGRFCGIKMELEEKETFEENDEVEYFKEPSESSPMKHEDKIEIPFLEFQTPPSQLPKPTNHCKNVTQLTETAKNVCDICGYSSHNKYKFKYHKRKHNKDLWLYCDLCPGRSFENKSYLIKHMRRFHLPRDMIACQLCGQTFNDHASRHYHHLSKHVDSSLWKLSCTVCGKKFYSKGHLKDHENTHTGEKCLY